VDEKTFILGAKEGNYQTVYDRKIRVHMKDHDFETFAKRPFLPNFCVRLKF